MAIVSNSSPLILYAKIGRLDLLHLLFTEVSAPQAVYEEVIGSGTGRAGAAEVRAATWIRVQPLTRRETMPPLLARLDRGEAEAIMLALELQLPDILLDDRDGRRAARERGLQVIGSAGVAILAKRRGMVPIARPILDELRAAGLYLSDTAYRGLLTATSE